MLQEIPTTAERDRLIADIGTHFSRLVEIGLNDLGPARRLEVAQLIQTRVKDLRFSISLLPIFRLTAYLYSADTTPEVLFHVGVAGELPTMN